MGRSIRRLRRHRSALLAGLALCLLLGGAVLVGAKLAGHPAAGPLGTLPDEYPAAFRAGLDRLDQGEPLELVGDTGGPLWYRWPLEAGRVALVAEPDQPLGVKTVNFTPLELVPAAPPPCYRLEAEVWQTLNAGQGEAGLFIAHDLLPQGDRPNHFFCLYGLSDKGANAGRLALTALPLQRAGDEAGRRGADRAPGRRGGPLAPAGRGCYGRWPDPLARRRGGASRSLRRRQRPDKRASPVTAARSGARRQPAGALGLLRHRRRGIVSPRRRPIPSLIPNTILRRLPMQHDGSSRVKLQLDISFPPQQAAPVLPVVGVESVGIGTPSDGQTVKLGAGGTLTVTGGVNPTALATQGAMTAWLTHQADNNTVVLQWVPPPPPPPPPTPGMFTFTTPAGGVPAAFQNSWVVLNVTAQDAPSNTLLGKSISVFLQP